MLNTVTVASVTMVTVVPIALCLSAHQKKMYLVATVTSVDATAPDVVSATTALDCASVSPATTVKCARRKRHSTKSFFLNKKRYKFHYYEKEKKRQNFFPKKNSQAHSSQIRLLLFTLSKLNIYKKQQQMKKKV